MLSQSMLKEIFGNLTWKGEIPVKYRPKELLAGDSAFDTDWKDAGNKYFAQKRFGDAIKAYTNGINAEKHSSSRNQLTLLANRSAAYLALHKYALGLDDAESVLIVDSTHIKCIFRKAKTLFGLSEYQKALIFLSDVSLDPLSIRHQQIVNDLIVESKSLILQSQTGAYPWLEIFQNKFDELAEFVGPVIVKNTATKGRGLFATDAIQAGQLIMGSKAFARIVDNRPEEFFLNTRFEHKSGRKSTKDRAQTQLIAEVAHILKEDPEKCQEVYNLYSGPEFSNHLPIGAHGSVIDMKKIEAICLYNQFGKGQAGVIRVKERESGLWLSPSYINHSCVDANSSWFTRGDFLFVFAFHNIAKDEEILISYMPPTVKRTTFFETHGFVCDCQLCIRDRQDDSTTQTKRSELIQRLDAILMKYEGAAMIPLDIKNDDVEITIILKSLSDLRTDAPELNLCYVDKIELLADVYLNNGQTLKALTILESVYDAVSKIPAFCSLSPSISTRFIGAYIILGQTNKVKEWIHILKRNCTMAYGTWKVIEVAFPFTYMAIRELGIILSEM